MVLLKRAVRTGGSTTCARLGDNLVGCGTQIGDEPLVRARMNGVDREVQRRRGSLAVDVPPACRKRIAEREHVELWSAGARVECRPERQQGRVG